MIKIINKYSVIISILVASIIGLAADDEVCYSSIIEVDGNLMPKYEKDIIEQYVDSVGNPVPVVFRGPAKDWEASKWSLDYLKEHFGDAKIDGPWRGGRSSKVKTLGDHIDKMLDDPEDAGYLEGVVYKDPDLGMIIGCLEDRCPSDGNYIYQQGQNPVACKTYCFVKNRLNLISSTSFPEIEIGSRPYLAYIMFLGPKGTRTPRHRHESTFLCQIYGEKRVLLSQREDEGSEIFEVILRPGDVLYIPNNCFHDVTALTASLSLALGS